jgi:hypothetical protein
VVIGLLELGEGEAGAAARENGTVPHPSATSKVTADTRSRGEKEEKEAEERMKFCISGEAAAPFRGAIRAKGT